ncbi:hypothetical protein ACHQM5_022772 [Ranunculus cassubicifolius]
METKKKKGHVMFVPFPAIGHINPMLNFSLLLVSRGVKVTIAVPLSVFHSVKPGHSEITVLRYSDGCDSGWLKAKNYLEVYKEIGPKNIFNLVKTQEMSEYPVKCLVYSSLFVSILDVAKNLGLSGGSFCTQSCAVHAVHYHVCQGHLLPPVEESVELDGFSVVLEVRDLPTTVTNKEPNPPFLIACLNQFSNLEDADWLFLNTFDTLEFEALSWMGQKWGEKIITMAPTVPSISSSNGLNPDLSSSIKWLNTKEAKSVVYVSFGSVFGLGEVQLEELASGIKLSNKNLLWVVKDGDESKLAMNVKDEMSEKGLVVSWCPQWDVLAHDAVGCFITHCGWNSTLEALSLGVPMIGMPMYMDQTTNAKFIQDVWKVGVRAKKNEQGIVGREVIWNCVKNVMEGERGAEIRKNADRFKELAKEAISEGGSSDRAIDKFIASLT